MNATAVPSLPWTYRPLGVRIMLSVLAALLIGVVVFLWVAMPASVRDDFSPVQVGTLLVFLLAALLGIWGLMRCRVRATDAGVDLVNGYRRRRLEWAQILQVSLRPGAPWAVLDLDDGTTVVAIALQGSDGRRARRGVAELRALLESQTRTNHND